MTVSAESLTEMTLREMKTLENVLVNDCWEALETMLAASQSGAIKPHLVQSFHKWQQCCKHHIMLFVFLAQSAAVLTLLIKCGFGSERRSPNPSGLCDRVPTPQLNRLSHNPEGANLNDPFQKPKNRARTH